jgi:DNA-binding NarL/FixJ family response regulator
MRHSHDLTFPPADDMLRRLVLARDPGPETATSNKHALWDALLAGQWSLLDAFTAGGVRYVVARRNSADDAAPRALGERERAVLELVLAGRSGKWIALDLHVSESTVARALRTALRRVGVVDTVALAGIKGALFETIEDPTTGIDLAIARLSVVATGVPALSDAERGVMTGILDGKRVAAIAHERGTSPRTVANQISSIYKKLGVSSRREILALLT